MKCERCGKETMVNSIKMMESGAKADLCSDCASKIGELEMGAESIPALLSKIREQEAQFFENLAQFIGYMELVFSTGMIRKHLEDSGFQVCLYCAEDVTITVVPPNAGMAVDDPQLGVGVICKKCAEGVKLEKKPCGRVQPRRSLPSPGEP